MGGVIQDDIPSSIDAAHRLLSKLSLNEAVEGDNGLQTLSGGENISFSNDDETYIGCLSVISHFDLPPYYRVLHTWVREVRPFQYRVAAIDLDVEDLAMTAGSNTVAIEITQSTFCVLDHQIIGCFR